MAGANFLFVVFSGTSFLYVCMCVFFFLLNLYGHLDSSLPCVDPNIYTHTATTTTKKKNVASEHSGKRIALDLAIRKTTWML